MSAAPMSPRTVRIALLICTHLSGPLRAANGDFYEIFNCFLKNSLPPASNTELVVDGFDVVEEMKYPGDNKIPEYDMIMVTGSPSAFEDIPWISHLVVWIQRVAEEHPKVKICGICFGHQIIGRALGGVCIRNGGGWEVGPTKVRLTDVGKSLFGADELSIQQAHQDHVPMESIPDSLSSSKIHLIGSTDRAVNQGLVKFHRSPSDQSGVGSHEQVHIITLQGHPEFNESIVTGIIRQNVVIPDADTMKDYFGGEGEELLGKGCPKGRRWWRNDGVDVVGRALWKILGVGSSDKVPRDKYC